MLLNVLDFTDPAAAFAVADHGDRVYFPGTREYEAPLGGWQINKGIEIFGDGPGTPTSRRGSILTPSSASGSANDVFVCNAVAPIGLPNIYIHDLWITRRINGPIVDGRHGIRYEPDTSNVQLSEVVFRRLRIDALGGSAIRLFGIPGTYGAVNNLLVEDCILENWGLPAFVWLKTLS